MTHDRRTVSAPSAGQGRLAFVDGLRGIAALVVTVGHAVLMVPPDRPIGDLFHTDTEHRLLWPFMFGSQMVFLFLMVSGFGLYWSEENRLAAGRPPTRFRVYAARRAWRILPTYYVALLLGLLVVVVGGPWLVDVAASYMLSAPVTPGGLFSHAVMAHNMEPGWTHQVNPPLWSLAYEVQLYLLLPLLVLIGARWSLCLGAALLTVAVEAVNAVSPVPVFGLCGYFCAGVVVAHLTRRHRLPRRVLLAVGLAGVAVGMSRLPVLTGGLHGQALWTAALACLLAGLASAPEGRFNVATWRPVVWLGHRSYSLYATHFPVLLAVWAVVGRLGLNRPAAIAAMLAAGVPVTVGVAVLCHRLVEVPSLARVRAVGRRAARPGTDAEPGVMPEERAGAARAASAADG